MKLTAKILKGMIIEELNKVRAVGPMHEEEEDDGMKMLKMFDKAVGAIEPNLDPLEANYISIEKLQRKLMDMYNLSPESAMEAIENAETQYKYSRDNSGRAINIQ